MLCSLRLDPMPTLSPPNPLARKLASQRWLFSWVKFPLQPAGATVSLYCWYLCSRRGRRLLATHPPPLRCPHPDGSQLALTRGADPVARLFNKKAGCLWSTVCSLLQTFKAPASGLKPSRRNPATFQPRSQRVGGDGPRPLWKVGSGEGPSQCLFQHDSSFQLYHSQDHCAEVF